MKIISLVSLILISCQGVLASTVVRLNQNNTVRQIEFEELLLNGRSNSGRLDIEKDRTFFVKVGALLGDASKPAPKNEKNNKYYTLISIKGGCLCSINNVVNDRGIKQPYASALIEDTLIKIAGNQLKTSLESRQITPFIFPRFPILYRTFEDEPLSFSNLFYMWEKFFNRAYGAIKAVFSNEAKTYASAFFTNFLKATQDIADFFQKAYDCGIFKPATTFSEISNFNREKEHFYWNIATLLENIYANLDKDLFLGIIYNLDRCLNKTFFSKISNLIENDPIKDRIFKGLTHEMPVVRNTYGKTLLINTFMFPNGVTNDETTKTLALCLLRSYGQLARLMKHIFKNNEYTHIYLFGEQLEASPRKSYWVLDEGVSLANFCVSLISRVQRGRAEFNVNNVEITQDEGKLNIVIDTEITKDQLKGVAEMKTVDRNGNIWDANGVRFVVRWIDNFFVFTTAFPIFIRSPNQQSIQTCSIFERFKDFVDLSKFPGVTSIYIEANANGIFGDGEDF